MSIFARGTIKVQKEEPNEESIGFVSEKVSFFSFQTAISIEWHTRNPVWGNERDSS